MGSISENVFVTHHSVMQNAPMYYHLHAVSIVFTIGFGGITSEYKPCVCMGKGNHIWVNFQGLSLDLGRGNAFFFRVRKLELR